MLIEIVPIVAACIGATATLVATFVTHSLTKRRDATSSDVSDDVVRRISSLVASKNPASPTRLMKEDIEHIQDLLPRPRTLDQLVTLLRRRVSTLRTSLFVSSGIWLLVIAYLAYPGGEDADNKTQAAPPAVHSTETAESDNDNYTTPRPGNMMRLKSDLKANCDGTFRGSKADYEWERCWPPKELRKPPEARIELYLFPFQTDTPRQEASPLSKERHHTAEEKICVDRGEPGGYWSRDGRSGAWYQYMQYRSSRDGGDIGKIWLEEGADLGVVVVSGGWTSALDERWLNARAVLKEAGYRLVLDRSVYGNSHPAYCPRG